MFRVIAENDVGQSLPSHNTQYITISAPGRNEAPSIQDPLKDIVCGLGHSVALSCVIRGIPQPDIKWYVRYTLLICF